MNKKSIKINYIYNVTYQILLLITPLITTPYISRVLSAEGIGSVSFAESIVSYFVMFATLGTSVLGQREISYEQDSKENRSRVFWNIYTIRMFSTLLCIIIYLVFIAVYKRNIEMYGLMVFNIVAVMMDVSWYFQGLEEFGKIVGRNVIFKIINIAFIFLFVREKEDILIYVAGIVIIAFLSNVSLWVYLPRLLAKPKKFKFEKRYFAEAMSLFIPTIAVQVYTVLDKTMIGVFTNGAAENGYYEQAIRISKMVLTLVTSLGTVMIPRISYYIGKKDYLSVKKYMYRSYQFVWFLTIPLCFGLIGISSNMVPWFFGEGYDKVKLLLKILAVLIIVIGLSNITGLQYLIPAKKQNLYTRTILIGAATNFVLNLFMIPRIYAIGAAIASVIAETAISVVQLYYVRDVLSIHKILSFSKKYLLAGSVMLSTLLVEGKMFSSSIIHTFMMIATGAIIYFGLLFIAKDEFLLEYVGVIRKRVKGR